MMLVVRNDQIRLLNGRQTKLFATAAADLILAEMPDRAEGQSREDIAELALVALERADVYRIQNSTAIFGILMMILEYGDVFDSVPAAAGWLSQPDAGEEYRVLQAALAIASHFSSEDEEFVLTRENGDAI